MIVFPSAKINLGLHVLGKRPDGFHEIETIFYPLGIRDALEILPEEEAGKGTIRLKVTGFDIPGDPEKNLCIRAYRLLAGDFDLPSVRMHLHKGIPPGSGLGGGSSDGAFTIRALDALFRLGLTDAVMTGYADRLGSDCAFFIEGRPVYAYGKGNRFIPLNMSLEEYNLAVVIPPVAVETAWAYSVVKPAGAKYSLKDTAAGCPESWRDLLINDFEGPVFREYPGIREIKEKLYGLGAAYASLSGSGSAVFGFFQEKEIDLSGFPGCFTWQLSGTG